MYLAVLLVLLGCFSSAMAADKVALVIGNANYSEVEKLKNPINDARAMARLFRKLGFEVMERHNVNEISFKNAVDTFGEKAENANLAVAYYAGHGIQVDGQNYLIPTNIVPQKKRDLRKLVSLHALVEEVGHASRFGLVILDACRNNPYGKSLTNTLNRSFQGRGLARLETTGKNVLVAFATKDGKIAKDGKGKHSPYTFALLKNLLENKDIRQILGQVRDDVMRKTRNQQQPFVYGSLGGGKYCLKTGCDSKIGKMSHTTGNFLSTEDRFWASAERCGTAACFRAYINKYKNGKYIELARSQLSTENKKSASRASISIKKPKKVANQIPKTKTKSSKTNQDITYQGRQYMKKSCGSIVDKMTGLEWYIGPNIEMTQIEASRWINVLRKCGGNWKMPSVTQIKTLYNKKYTAGMGYFARGKYWPAHIHPIFKRIGKGTWVWLNGKAFNLNQGFFVHDKHVKPEYSIRIFAVR